MIKLILITTILITLAIAAMGINALFSKKRRFPQASVGKNKKMRELGLSCAKSEEIKCRKEINNKNYCDACGQ